MGVNPATGMMAAQPAPTIDPVTGGFTIDPVTG